MQRHAPACFLLEFLRTGLLEFEERAEFQQRLLPQLSMPIEGEVAFEAQMGKAQSGAPEIPVQANLDHRGLRFRVGGLAPKEAGLCSSKCLISTHE